MVKEYSYIKRMLLRELSENSRTSVTALAEKLKCSRNTVLNNIKALEREFGLYYTLDPNLSKMGILQNHVWNVKFGVKPDTETLKEIFKDDSFIQFAVETDGDFDMVLKVITTSGEEYVSWGLDTAMKLLDYRPVIRPSLISMIHTGFVPVPNSVIEKIGAEKLGLDALDVRMLLLLNEDSTMTYNAMAKRLKVDVETIRYRFRRILDSGIIDKFTVLATKVPSIYNVAFFVNYEFAPGFKERYSKVQEFYLGVDGQRPLLNSFQYLALTSGSYTLFGLGSFTDDEKAIKNAVVMHKLMYKEDNAQVRYAKVTNEIRGHLPIRNIDMARHFKGISWEVPKNTKKGHDRI
ncbi:MAG: Lrp/AsnC family transcriptional regulator [Candidatus Micrarchaeota archaeon]|nr:Lrp/AsnC family transcriptional regulator [Candidatus Micrarchaeota archaeon]MDE1824483.1 Lrp/AsnC family transcriptional regulator [Candidatus Micrarchaeota archaeon]